jgi:hypothetical protein
MKPQLPHEIRLKFPPEIVHIIASYVPHLPLKEYPSPSLQREFKRIQTPKLHGKNEMYLKDFDDFLLDER